MHVRASDFGIDRLHPSDRMVGSTWNSSPDLLDAKTPNSPELPRHLACFFASRRSLPACAPSVSNDRALTILSVIVYGVMLIAIQQDYLPKTDARAVSAAALTMFP